MKMTIDADIMKDTFKSWDRDYYTYEACEALESWYDEIDPDFEFDAIAICCDWIEYGETPCLTWKDFISDYKYLLEEAAKENENINPDEMDEAAKCEMIMDILENKTTIIRLNNSVLVAAF